MSTENVLLVTEAAPLGANDTELEATIRRIVREEMGQAPPPPDEFITLRQAARLLDLSEPSVDKYRRQGLLTGYRQFGKTLYKKHEIEAAPPKIAAFKHEARLERIARGRAAKEPAAGR